MLRVKIYINGVYRLVLLQHYHHLISALKRGTQLFLFHFLLLLWTAKQLL